MPGRRHNAITSQDIREGLTARRMIVFEAGGTSRSRAEKNFAASGSDAETNVMLEVHATARASLFL
jgi:hypothetical protein